MLLRWVSEKESDIFFLQELNAADDRCPGDTPPAAGWDALCSGPKSWNGVVYTLRDLHPDHLRLSVGADLDRDVPGRKKACDHAPWTEVTAKDAVQDMEQYLE